MKKWRISCSGLEQWLQKLEESGRKIFAPKKKAQGVDFARIDSSEEMAWDFVQTLTSPKSFLFPKVEKLFAYGRENQAMRLENEGSKIAETVVFGLRPCDAAGLDALEKIFHWDSIDPLVQKRREALTLVTLACSRSDEHCFCTSVGGGPGEAAGSDLLVIETGENDFLVEGVSAKGEALVQAAPEIFLPETSSQREAQLTRVPAFFQLEKLKNGLHSLFDREEIWTEQSLRCIGCGACAFVCPTCACFDIQDEGTRRRGRRVRLWDSCGFSLFTLHASGHNPRERQSERWRQRLMHKFSYMPERLDVVGCVGCGRCSRACPVDMNIREHLHSLEEKLK